MIKKIFTISVIIVLYVATLACKSRILGPIFPIEDFSEYNSIVIAKVENAKHQNQGYSPLKSFKITIKQSLKGNLQIGEKISGLAKVEEPRARCPVHLDKNSDYLMLLTKDDEGYKLSRFSYPVKNDYVYFDDYIKQIEKLLANEKDN